MSIEDYDILNILGNSINSATYKVKQKKTDEIFVWQTVDCENLRDSEKCCLIELINNRKNLKHPNLLKFYEFIEQKESKILYLVTEFSENGSLRNIIQSCLRNNTYLSEELVCKILFQVALTIKTIEGYRGKLGPSEIYLDEDYNVKLYNFKLDNKRGKELKMCHLGLTLYELCTFIAFDKHNYENEIKEINNLYSRNLLTLVIHMIKDNNDLKKNINKILCHPTILLKSTQWSKEKSFLKIKAVEKDFSKKIEAQDIPLYSHKMEKLRDKELMLQVREQSLCEREHRLATKERKLSIMERNIKEKLQQAELYLKRCRESKSVSAASSKSNISSQPEKKLTYDNLDSTYVSCGDSIILPTSSKLNVNEIVKPASFTRTMSERRIRFKGHSPLKEIDFNKRKSVRHKTSKTNTLRKNSEWLTCSEDTDKSSIEGSTGNIHNKARKLFPAYENNFDVKVDVNCKPISWTEENKKYAFELLKLMNDEKENQPAEVKHTLL